MPSLSWTIAVAWTTVVTSKLDPSSLWTWKLRSVWALEVVLAYEVRRFAWKGLPVRNRVVVPCTVGLAAIVLDALWELAAVPVDDTDDERIDGFPLRLSHIAGPDVFVIQHPLALLALEIQTKLKRVKLPYV